MPLHINLLHEEQAKLVQRERDPLKIGMLGLLVVGLCFYGYYLFHSISTGHLQSQRLSLEDEVARLEPKAAEAKGWEDQSNQMVAATANLEKIINGRFYFGPVLESLIKNTGPEIQISKMSCAYVEPSTLNIDLEGLSAGQEPRAAAEKFRQHLQEVLNKLTGPTGSQFTSLEDNPAKIMMNGKNLDTAVFKISFNVTIQPDANHAKVQ